MPNMLTMRPGDGNETAGCYYAAVQNAMAQNPKGIKRPSTLVFSRQGMPNMDTTSIEGCLKGAYVVHGGDAKPDVILIGERREAGLGQNTQVAPLLADQTGVYKGDTCWHAASTCSACHLTPSCSVPAPQALAPSW